MPQLSLKAMVMHNCFSRLTQWRCSHKNRVQKNRAQKNRHVFLLLSLVIIGLQISLSHAETKQISADVVNKRLKQDESLNLDTAAQKKGANIEEATRQLNKQRKI